MRVKFCPKCKNIDLILEAGGITGIMRCKKCGYYGAIFPEKEINKRLLVKKQK